MMDRSDAGMVVKPRWVQPDPGKEKKIDSKGNRKESIVSNSSGQFIGVIKTPSKTPEDQIADLKAQIKALKAQKRTPRKSGVQMMTSSVRAEKAEAQRQQIMDQLKKLYRETGGHDLSPSQIVDIHMGGLADLA